MRVVVALVTVLIGSLALSATLAGAQATPQPHELVTNPAFAHWAGFKRGTTVNQKQTITLAGGRRIEHEITVRLVEKSPDKVVIETIQTPSMNAMVSLTRTYTTFPARVLMGDVHTPRSGLESFTEGEEGMTVAGKKVTAHWVKAVTRNGDEVATRTVWSAREVPGGTVKETMVRKRGDQVLSDSRLEVVGIKVP
jgi:hypothetical protein